MGYEGRYERNERGRSYGNRDWDDRSRYGGDRPQGYDYEDRGFFDRAGDEVRSWFGDEEAERRRRRDEQEYGRRYSSERSDYGQGRSDWDRSDRSERSNRYNSGRGYAGYDTGSRGGYGYASGGGFGGAEYSGYGTGGSTSYAPYRGDTYRENSSDRYDPHYHEWRARQIYELDRDYDDYRRENQSRFNQDFGSWRSNRQNQRATLNNVQEHQEVVGSDGAHVGTVDHVRSDRIILTKNDDNAGGRHHSIPCSWINRVSDKVELNRSAAEAQQAWKDEERRAASGGRGDDNSDGPHILDRSFSGTY